MGSGQAGREVDAAALGYDAAAPADERRSRVANDAADSDATKAGDLVVGAVDAAWRGDPLVQIVEVARLRSCKREREGRYLRGLGVQ